MPGAGTLETWVLLEEPNHVPMAGTNLAGDRFCVTDGERAKPPPTPAEGLDGASDEGLDGRFSREE